MYNVWMMLGQEREREPMLKQSVSCPWAFPERRTLCRNHLHQLNAVCESKFWNRPLCRDSLANLFWPNKTSRLARALRPVCPLRESTWLNACVSEQKTYSDGSRLATFQVGIVKRHFLVLVTENWEFYTRDKKWWRSNILFRFFWVAH